MEKSFFILERVIGSVTATTHQEKGIITLESNPSRGKTKHKSWLLSIKTAMVTGQEMNKCGICGIFYIPYDKFREI